MTKYSRTRCAPPRSARPSTRAPNPRRPNGSAGTRTTRPRCATTSGREARTNGANCPTAPTWRSWAAPGTSTTSPWPSRTEGNASANSRRRSAGSDDCAAGSAATRPVPGRTDGLPRPIRFGLPVLVAGGAQRMQATPAAPEQEHARHGDEQETLLRPLPVRGDPPHGHHVRGQGDGRAEQEQPHPHRAARGGEEPTAHAGQHAPQPSPHTPPPPERVTIIRGQTQLVVQARVHPVIGRPLRARRPRQRRPHAGRLVQSAHVQAAMMHAGQHARHPRVQPIPVEPDRRARREDAHPIRQAGRHIRAREPRRLVRRRRARPGPRGQQPVRPVHAFDEPVHRTRVGDRRREPAVQTVQTRIRPTHPDLQDRAVRRVQARRLHIHPKQQRIVHTRSGLFIAFS
ncbi:hypothetical protein BBKW_1077 [Bifidobacterium catenulatum subsp. kashiwanohense JCM 15439 = DSM 21854]|nr:hypothetical protein BBKW_1077 [Bifidobacterium catenulatum subsp. kashiwanohense JCM 15439 = DSM 21854]